MDKGDLKKIFNVSGHPCGMYVLRYVSTENVADGMTEHLDVPPTLFRDQQIMTVVFTFKTTDHKGGAIKISNRFDGLWEESLRAQSSYTPPDNSAYAFNGSCISHKVEKTECGTRYSIVLFYPTNQTHDIAILLWNGGLNHSQKEDTEYPHTKRPNRKKEPITRRGHLLRRQTNLSNQKEVTEYPQKEDTECPQKECTETPHKRAKKKKQPSTRRGRQIRWQTYLSTKKAK